MNYKLTCRYCGYSLITTYKASQCPKCMDSNVELTDVKSSNVYGYEEEETEEDYDTWGT